MSAATVSLGSLLPQSLTERLRTDRHAIDVNQDYAGFSGSLFASSSELTTISPCTGGSPGGDPNSTSCVFPVTQSWYKPLSGLERRKERRGVLHLRRLDKVLLNKQLL